MSKDDVCVFWDVAGNDLKLFRKYSENRLKSISLKLSKLFREYFKNMCSVKLNQFEIQCVLSMFVEKHIV